MFDYVAINYNHYNRYRSRVELISVSDKDNFIFTILKRDQ